MKAKYGPTPIPIPPIINDERYIGRFSRAVRKSICALRDRSVIVNGGGGSSGGSSGTSSSNFCSIIDTTDEPPDKAIKGGLIRCGDQNFNVNDYVLDLGTDGTWLVQIELTDIEAATDDDGEIFLPGVITSTSTPAWDLKAWTDPTDYDANTNPTSPASPTGTIILPVGKLIIADGVPSLRPTACGNFLIGQCAGILNYSRA